MKLLLIVAMQLLALMVNAQKDTLVQDEIGTVTLQEVIVRNNVDYKSILKTIKLDTTFYKAFRNLRIIEYDAYNSISMRNKQSKIVATYNSKSHQKRAAGCRATSFSNIQTTGNFFDADSNYNYTTAKLYASLFFSKGKECGETNIVKGTEIDAASKKGFDKHREQLKTLFFNPGKKIPGIPFIGNKLDLYDERAHEYYDYRLDYTEYEGKYAYTFSIKPKEGLEKSGDLVVDEMTTWFNAKTMEVMARNYRLSYNAGVYSFNVNMEVQMTTVGNLLVPRTLRYKGKWNVLFKGREDGEFTATLFNFKQ